MFIQRINMHLVWKCIWYNWIWYRDCQNLLFNIPFSSFLICTFIQGDRINSLLEFLSLEKTLKQILWWIERSVFNKHVDTVTFRNIIPYYFLHLIKIITLPLTEYILMYSLFIVNILVITDLCGALFEPD